MTVNASGAAAAGKAGNVVVVVDVIDMSTTIEAAIDAGALHTFGASPDFCRAPVELNPRELGRQAGLAAVEAGTGIVIISEPRVGSDEDRKARCRQVIAGITEAGAAIDGIFPNVGAETAKLGDLRNKVVIAVTDTGGAAYDAAYTAGAPVVLTGTIARTLQKKGSEPARAAAKRAIEEARARGVGIAVVAASANSLEDILAAEFIVRQIIEEGYTKI